MSLRFLKNNFRNDILELDFKTLQKKLQKQGVNVDPELLINAIDYYKNQNISNENFLEQINCPDFIQTEDGKLYEEIKRDFILEISEDKMFAYLVVNPGTLMTAEYLLNEMNNKGIKFGIDKKTVDDALNNPGIKHIVARGKEPQAGSNAKIKYKHLKPDVKPLINNDDTVNYRELGNRILVKAGEILAAYTPPTPGIDGINVYGEPIKAAAGVNVILKTGKGITIVDDKAIAEYDGALSWNEFGEIYISKTLIINGDVDFSTGNIDFAGTVIIYGNVKDGFSVKAQEHVEIKGIIEGTSVVSYRGSIYVQKGIIGKESAVIGAYQDVETSFVQDATITAGNHVIVSEYILRSNINAGNAILVYGPKGRILGMNYLRARTRIQAKVIQTPKTLTLIVIGINRSEYYSRIQALNKEIKKLDNTKDTLLENIKNISPHDIEGLNKKVNAYVKADVELKSLLKERDFISEQLKASVGDGVVEIGKILEGSVIINIKGKAIILDSNSQKNRFYYNSINAEIMPFS